LEKAGKNLKKKRPKRNSEPVENRRRRLLRKRLPKKSCRKMFLKKCPKKRGEKEDY
jgi:hypothetical protein